MRLSKVREINTQVESFKQHRCPGPIGIPMSEETDAIPFSVNDVDLVADVGQFTAQRGIRLDKTSPLQSGDHITKKQVGGTGAETVTLRTGRDHCKTARGVDSNSFTKISNSPVEVTKAVRFRKVFPIARVIPALWHLLYLLNDQHIKVIRQHDRSVKKKQYEE